MKHFAFLLTTSLLITLNGCTTGSNRVEIANIFGLNGQSLTLVNEGGTTTTFIFKGSFTDLPFTDLDANTKIPELFQGLTPNLIGEVLGLESEATVTSAQPEEALPETLTVSTTQLQIKIVDASGSPEVNKKFESEEGLALTFTKQSCTVEATLTVCDYDVVASEELLNLELIGSDLRTFYNDIWTDGDDGEARNTLSASFTFTMSGDKLPPSDCEVEIVLKSSRGALEF